MIGQKFNNWTVIAESDKRKQGSKYYLCECSCEKKTKREILKYSLK